MKKNYKKYNYKTKVNFKAIIEKRYYILITTIAIIMIILTWKLFSVQMIEQNYFQNKVKEYNQNIIDGPTAPRGRIYDRNGKLIVDNQAVKVISYKKPNKVKTEDEINLAYLLADMLVLDISKLTETQLKEFWIKQNLEKADELITAEERQKQKERKLTKEEIEKYKRERITKEMLESLKEKDKKAAYIYALMNKGYSYAEKIIKGKNVTDIEFATISENSDKLPGIDIKLEWSRYYPYQDTFRTILGTVSSSTTGIPADLKDHYLKKGYALTDQVGVSYLEYQYDDYLKGEKNRYEVKKDGTYRLIEEGIRGNDLVLTIDIELQKEVENIIVNQLLSAKKEPNTEYYNKAFVIIADPKTGEILAMAGKQIVYDKGKYKVYDYTPGILTSPVTVGSAIKGASHIVGYNTGALKIGEIRDDSCIKIAATNEKCSWMYLGQIDDITALKQSSNTYQFRTAIKVGKASYSYNAPLKIDTKAFDIYRDTFAQFGLGVKTGIDLPVESLGYKGSSRTSGLLLDFAIGQYDNYTPIQLSQYIGTIANNGNRMQPHLLKKVYKKDSNLKEILYEPEVVKLNTIDTQEKYLKRVQTGFKAVLEPYGTGYYFIDPKYHPAGKTGTSQSFIDTNLDGKIDTETITNTFVAYAPYENPKVTFTIISPDVSHYHNYSQYQSNVNSRIADQVSKKYFQFYK